MLTHHFYDSQGLRNLDAFLASVHHLLIVCDPPFGVFMDALVPSLNKLRSRHVEITNKLDFSFSSFVLLAHLHFPSQALNPVAHFLSHDIFHFSRSCGSSLL